jgi:membrane protein
MQDDKFTGKYGHKLWLIIKRVKTEQTDDNLPIVAAGVAYFFLLAIFPGLAAMVSLYGIVSDPAHVQELVANLSRLLPQQAYEIIDEELHRIVSQSGEALGSGLIGGLLLALWSSSKGIKALITAMNIAFDEEETRGFFRLNALSLAFTVGGLIFILVSLGLIAALPAIIGWLGLPGIIVTVTSILRWPWLILMVVVALTVIYRYVPDRGHPRWQWMTWGSALATILWIAASYLFSFYVSHFGSYNKTYGSVGAVVILLMWFFITAYLILLGAELNSEVEQANAKKEESETSALNRLD